MKLKKTLLVSVLLLTAACTDKDNSVKVDMLNCEGVTCSFDASKSRIKSHSQILEYDWDFHDDTDMTVTKDPKVSHDFNIYVGATLDGNDPDLDLRELTLDEVLTNHRIISKKFDFRTHQHDPLSTFTNRNLLGASTSKYPVFHFDASESQSGQGTVKEYIWNINGKIFNTTEPMLEYQADSNRTKVTLTVVNSFNVKAFTTQSFVGLEPVVEEIYATKVSDLHYTFSYYYTDGDTSDEYDTLWKLNGKVITSVENVPVVLGENTISVSLYEKNTKREVSKFARTFDTTSSVTPKIIEILPIKINYSDGLHYALTANYENTLDTSKYQRKWYINDRFISNDNAKNVIVDDRVNNARLDIISRATGDVVDSKNVNFTAQEDSVSVNKVLFSMASDNMHYDIVSLVTGFNPDTQKKVFELNGSIITDINDVPFIYGLNTVYVKIVDKVSGSQIAIKKGELDTNINTGIREVYASLTPNADEFHYDLSADYSSDFNPNKYDIAWVYNDKTVQPQNLQLEEGLNIVYLYIKDKNTGRIITGANKKITINAKVPEIKDVEITVDKDLANDGLEYSFTEQTTNMNKYYHTKWILNGKILSSSSKQIVDDGSNILELQIINNYTGDIVNSSIYNFTAARIVQPAFTSNVTATEVEDSDGLHYDFAVSTNAYDKSKYDVVYKLNDKIITEIKNVLVKKSTNTVVVQLIAKDGTVAVETSTDFEATLNKPIPTIFLAQASADDSQNYTFEGKVDYNGRSSDEFSTLWMIDGVKTFAKNKLSTIYTFADSQVGKHMIKLIVIDKNGVEYKTEGVQIDVKAQQKPIPYQDTPAAIIGQGIHSEHKGNSGASFPYITIDLNESVQNKGVNFITGERLWNGKVGNNDTPYEQGNSYLHFNTGSATQEGFYDFSIELAKGDIHQVGTYSCKQKTTLWAIVWEPDLYDCTPIVWKDAYKV